MKTKVIFLWNTWIWNFSFFFSSNSSRWYFFAMHFSIILVVLRLVRVKIHKTKKWRNSHQVCRNKKKRILAPNQLFKWLKAFLLARQREQKIKNNLSEAETNGTLFLSSAYLFEAQHLLKLLICFWLISFISKCVFATWIAAVF